ncbi:hypothetical protein ABWE86_005129 [Vibrio parahaemolyticus]
MITETTKNIEEKNTMKTQEKNRFFEIVSKFKAFVNAKESERESSHIFEMYILYAVIRGKDPKKTSHDPSTDSYEEALGNVKGFLEQRYKPSKWLPKGNFANTLIDAFGLTEEEMKMYREEL